MSSTPRELRQHVPHVGEVQECLAKRMYQDEIPITGLRASNSGPTPFGDAAWFHAAIDSGTNVHYEWDCGDGHTAYGSSIHHNYAEPGIYRARVIARNDVSEMEATTLAVVDYHEVWDSPTSLTSSLEICDDEMEVRPFLLNNYSFC